MTSARSPVRARDLGVRIGSLTAGPTDSIVDVPGVRVGHSTIREIGRLHTGVTAIVPDRVDRAGGRVPAGLFVGNGYGKLVGATQLTELGELETPVLLTGTLSAFRAADALVTYVLGLPGNEALRTVNPVVGETNDGYLSDIRARPVRTEHVFAALRGASTAPVAEGCVGAGTGTCALGFKAGIGTASRIADAGGRPARVGVLVQANFSGTLRVHGRQVTSTDPVHPQGNSCMIIVAVEAGLDSRQLRRVATRGVLALGGVGSEYGQGSGDYAIAFSTGDPESIPDTLLNPLFRATIDATQEAVLNSLIAATDTVGVDGHVRAAVPHDLIRAAARSADR